MSLTALSIAASGMRVATVRLNASASNIANMQSAGRVPGSGGNEVFMPLEVTSREVGGNGASAGADYTVSTRSDGYAMVHDPNSPNADGAGMVAMPDVDIAGEMVDVIMAKSQFAFSAAVAKAAGEMEKTGIDILV